MSASVFALIIALFVCHIQNNLTAKHPSGICRRTSTGVECCTDYVKDGNKCLPCLGSFGPQCSKTCLPGFYGFGCKMKCTCGVCDRFNGSCLEETDVNVTESTICSSSIYSMSTEDQDVEPLFQHQFVWFLVGITSSSTFVVIIIVILVLCVIKRCRGSRLSSANIQRTEMKSSGTTGHVYETAYQERYV
ncbi:uncharacterized protein LOC130054085 [Ostrea edulis]|uniref:uncharacterized protein LOC130054085 n=1 Tax=Ostrea edulis TaxID=37623 RepID=UPI0024AF54DE|nr:uncharacterized protein LOC130054085 [Ostrea edulis]